MLRLLLIYGVSTWITAIDSYLRVMSTLQSRIIKLIEDDGRHLCYFKTGRLLYQNWSIGVASCSDFYPPYLKVHDRVEIGPAITHIDDPKNERANRPD